MTCKPLLYNLVTICASINSIPKILPDTDQFPTLPVMNDLVIYSPGCLRLALPVGHVQIYGPDVGPLGVVTQDVLKHCLPRSGSAWRYSSWANLTITPTSVRSRRRLKALFNNVFTFKNLSCMSLHAISVFDKVYK